VRLEDGTFAEYIIVKGDLQIHTPENLSDEEAATLGIGITTVVCLSPVPIPRFPCLITNLLCQGQGMYQTLGLPLPTEPAKESFPLFIYGGSTATGVLGIQFAKASNLTVITTSSPKNFAYLKSLGADHVFDYKSPTLVQDARAAAGVPIRYAWDCQADEASARICGKVLSEGKDNKYAALLFRLDGFVKEENKGEVDTAVSLFYTVFGEDYCYSGRKPAVPSNLDYGKFFWELSRELLVKGTVKPIKIAVNQGGSGLEGVMKGMDDLREGKVSAGKLVYRL
jgi:hypothetical protein